MHRCLVCLRLDSGVKASRPQGQKMHSESVGELLHFDFLYIGDSVDENEYVLILKHYYSEYVFLRTCKHADAGRTAEVMMEYFTTFVPVLNELSDQGTHFKNEVMELLAISLGANHRFSTAYVPSSNGTVEAVCKQVLRGLRAFSSEFGVPESLWTKTVLAIQSIINNSLGNRAPLTVHTGMSSGNPLSVALTTIGFKNIDSVNEVRSIRALNIDELLSSLDILHKEVSSEVSQSCKKAVDAHNAKTHVKPSNVFVGDYRSMWLSRAIRNRGRRCLRTGSVQGVLRSAYLTIYSKLKTFSLVRTKSFMCPGSSTTKTL